MDGRRLQEYDNIWKVIVRYDDGRVDERGLSSDHVRFRSLGGRRYLTRIEGTTLVVGKPDEMPRAQFSMTFNVFDPVNMTPLIGSETSDDGSTLRQFDGNKVVVSALSHSPKKTIELQEKVFDFNGGMTGLLLAALPLRVGYAATLPALGENGFETDSIRVVRSESVAAGRLGSRTAFVVEIGPEPSRSVYWISTSAPYVIKAEVRAPNAVVTWEML